MTTWNAETILGTARCYWECRILLTVAELDLFARLQDGPRTAAELAEMLHLDPRGLTMLLDAVTALGLLDKRDGKFACPADVARLLVGSGSGSVLPMVLHSAFQWYKWTDLTEIVRGTTNPHRRPRSPESLKAFIEAMDVVSTPRAAGAVRAARPGAARRLIDVGGGPGTYTAAFLRACPGMTATLFDLPDVIEIARERLEAAGLLDRVTLVGGDFYADELPGAPNTAGERDSAGKRDSAGMHGPAFGHDLAWVSAIIHQNSRAQNVALYRKVFHTLIPGGRIVVRDHVLEAERTQPRAGAIFAVNMLVSTEGGNCYTFDEIRADLRDAGFERVNLLARDEQMTGLVEAFKP